MPLQLCLLGNVELYVGGHLAGLGPAKRRAMLAALALEADQPVSLTRLVEAVWVGPAPRSAVANLRTHATALRRILGDRIVAVPGGYRLHLGREQVDAYEFLRMAERGRRALGTGDALQAMLQLTAALGLWRGANAGDGLSRGTWLDPHFAGLDEQRLRALEDLVEARLALADHRDVLPTLRQHLARHPLRERAWGQLMLALYRADDSAGALETYQSARAALRDQLGVEPGPDLTALQHAILQRDPALAPPPVRPPAPIASAPGLGACARRPAGQLRPYAARLADRAEELAAELAELAVAMRAANLTGTGLADRS
jgi:DNA-binding SARP family transcriptional activator